MAARASSRTPAGKRRTRHAQPRPPRTGYLDQTRRPLQSLVFLLPLVMVYEVGIFLAYPPFSGKPPTEVQARVLLNWLMSLFGATGYHLAGLIVVAALLGWHVLRKDPWRLKRRVLGGMAAESVLLALPMLMFHALLAAGGRALSGDWADLVLLSMSAGIYEELVFRLLLISLLTFLLSEVVNLRHGPAEVLAVLLSSIIFAAHHCQGLGGSEPFVLTRFLFRAAAGVYLAGVFVLRGFGIAVGCHTLYDVIVVSAG